MTNIKISALSSGTTLAGSEIIPMVQSGADVTGTAQQIANLSRNAGGSETTTTSSNVTLTNTNKRVQVISITANDKNVALPAANTLSSNGGPLYIIINNGQCPFTVVDNAGSKIAIVDMGEMVMLSCSDITTAAGVWIVGHMNNGLFISPKNVTKANRANLIHTASSISTSQCRGQWLTPISSTQAIVTWFDQLAVAVKACIITRNADNTLTIGGIVTVDGTIGAGTIATATTLLTTGVVMCVYTSTTPNATTKAVILSISGTTITVNTAVTVEAATANGLNVFTVSSTQAFIVYGKISATGKAGSLSVSGTTITVNTLVAVGTSSPALNTVSCMLSPTSFLVCCSITANETAQICSLSGTTTTAGAAVNMPAFSGYYVSPTAVYLTVATINSTTAVYAAVSGGTSQFAGLITVSGTTPAWSSGFGLGTQDDNLEYGIIGCMTLVVASSEKAFLLDGSNLKEGLGNNSTLKHLVIDAVSSKQVNGVVQDTPYWPAPWGNGENSGTRTQQSMMVLLSSTAPYGSGIILTGINDGGGNSMLSAAAIDLVY